MSFNGKIRTLFIVAVIGAVGMLLPSCLKEKADAPVIVNPDSTVIDKTLYKDKAGQVYNDIVKKYFTIPGTNMFLESYPAQSGDPKQAYFWPYSGVFTGAVLLKKTGVTVDLEKLFAGLEEFWDASRLPAGYQSAPLSEGPSDRYYDDNGTVGLNLMEAYQVTNDVKYLDKAEACLLFTMSGESDEEGGGLFWCEQYRTNNIASPNTVKAANSTAFATSLALKVYKYRKKQEYLDFAKRLYAWNKTKMQDPGDKMFWNDVALSTHKVNTTKWTYNVGQMLSAACMLYTITQDAAYLTDAKAMAKGSYDVFTRPVRDLGRFFPDHDSWFNAILFRGYLDLNEIDKTAATEYISTFIKNADHAWKNARTKDGFFYEDWSGDRLGRYYWVLQQAVMVEVYARISLLKNE